MIYRPDLHNTVAPLGELSGSDIHDLPLLKVLRAAQSGLSALPVNWAGSSPQASQRRIMTRFVLLRAGYRASPHGADHVVVDITLDNHLD